MTLPENILIELDRLDALPLEKIEPVPSHLMGAARVQAYDIFNAKRDQQKAAVQGWHAPPPLGTPMQRSRAVAKLVERGYIETRGRSKGKQLRLTDTGRAAAEAMEGGAGDE